MSINRILSGNPITPLQLKFAGLFILLWFIMDLTQFVGFVVELLK